MTTTEAEIGAGAGAEAGTGAEQDRPSTVDVLYTAELVHRDGTYTLIVRDLVHDVRKTTTVPRRMVGKIPLYLSMLHLDDA
ncbi:hypothetical protein ACFY7C_18015 [Streptomyces sp. NPDC012769]|uniref:hypothetical protein n=1 Tax=Streptomyces sp. NPDC012769 TaxID=3364848 RepID=UPI0036A66ED4